MTAPHEQVKNGNVLRFIKDYWFIILAIIGMAMSWADIKTEMTANAETNDKQDVVIQQNTKDINDLEKKYIEDVTFIKTTLQELKARNNN